MKNPMRKKRGTIPGGSRVRKTADSICGMNVDTP